MWKFPLTNPVLLCYTVTCTSVQRPAQYIDHMMVRRNPAPPQNSITLSGHRGPCNNLMARQGTRIDDRSIKPATERLCATSDWSCSVALHITIGRISRASSSKTFQQEQVTLLFLFL